MCVCVCAGVLMVDVSGDPFKGSIMYQNRVWKARKKKKGRGQQRREREREREAEDEMLMATGNKRNSHRGQRKTQSTV